MDIAYCNEYMTEALKYFLLSYVIYLCVLGILFFAAWIYRIIKIKKGLSKKDRNEVVLMMIMLALVAGYQVFGLYAIPAAKDLEVEDYIAVHGTFERYSGRNKGIVAHVRCGMKPDGQDKAIHLTLVTENYKDEEKFPIREELTGTVIYANKSKIVLDFIPDSQQD